MGVTISTVAVTHFIFFMKISEKNQMATPKEFTRKDGPFMCALEDALQSFSVERQAYHGGSFVGNHVHMCLRVRTSQITMHVIVYINRKLQLVSITNYMQTCNIKILTAAVSKTAEKQGALNEEAKAIEITFQKVFTLFQECRDNYSRAKAMTDEEIDYFSKHAAFC